MCGHPTRPTCPGDSPFGGIRSFRPIDDLPVREAVDGSEPARRRSPSFCPSPQRPTGSAALFHAAPRTRTSPHKRETSRSRPGTAEVARPMMVLEETGGAPEDFVRTLAMRQRRTKVLRYEYTWSAENPVAQDFSPALGMTSLTCYGVRPPPTVSVTPVRRAAVKAGKPGLG